MGTRADFYIGRGKDAEWIGSIAMDGYPADEETSRAGIPWRILRLTSEENFREAAVAYVNNQSHGTIPDEGWPWPWDDSRTTDFAYAYDGGKVFASCFGRTWHDPIAHAQADSDEQECVSGEWSAAGKVDFPDMKPLKNVTTGVRSGLIIVGIK